MSEWKDWPDDWPLYKQSCFGSWEKACDMLVGACSCGASHAEGEFEMRDGKLFRYGKEVETLPRSNRIYFGGISRSDLEALRDGKRVDITMVDGAKVELRLL